MRNVLLLLCIVLLVPSMGAAQTFLVQNGDSVTGYYTQTAGDMIVRNPIKSASSTAVTLNWKCVGFSIGPNWTMTGFCDNIQCYANSPSTDPPNGLILNTFSNGSFFSSDPVTNANYNTSANDFHILYDGSAAAAGTSSWVTINFKDAASAYERNLTFIGRKNAAGVYTMTTSSDDIVLYPNPAKEAVNIIFNGRADVKSIGVYNLIGKLMGPIYKPSSNNSAKIDLEEMPNGIYFVRLMNSQGQVVGTRRFIRQ